MRRLEQRSKPNNGIYNTEHGQQTCVWRASYLNPVVPERLKEVPIQRAPEAQSESCKKQNFFKKAYSFFEVKLRLRRKTCQSKYDTRDKNLPTRTVLAWFSDGPGRLRLLSRALSQYGKKAVLYFWFANEDDNYINTRIIIVIISKKKPEFHLAWSWLKWGMLLYSYYIICIFIFIICIFLDYKRVVRATMAAGVQS